VGQSPTKNKRHKLNVMTSGVKRKQKRQGINSLSFKLMKKIIFIKISLDKCEKI
jgi:hypothetical protein